MQPRRRFTNAASDPEKKIFGCEWRKLG